MQTTDFRMILDSISGLTPTQRETLLSALQRGEIGLLREVLRELAIDGVTCPRCASSQVIGWGRARGLPRWRCKECRRTFNPLTGTGGSPGFIVGSAGRNTPNRFVAVRSCARRLNDARFISTRHTGGVIASFANLG